MENGGKTYTVTVAQRAADMLVYHARFLAQVSESAALRLVSQFEAKIKTLGQMPERCPWLFHPVIPEHKL
jgi:plasmid stabilization system protein ParE